MTGEMVQFSGAGDSDCSKQQGVVVENVADGGSVGEASRAPFQGYVRWQEIPARDVCSPQKTSTVVAAKKKSPTKSLSEMQAAVDSSKWRELKNAVRLQHWPIDDPIRCHLWKVTIKSESSDTDL